MFTEGLDESAINWVKQQEREPVRSPLMEKLSPHEQFPMSPLAYKSRSYLSPHALPPLRFHSGLFAPQSLMTPCLDDDDDESIGSISDEVGGSYNFSGVDEKEIDISGPRSDGFLDIPNSTGEVFAPKPSTKLNRWFSKENLRIEMPDSNRRLTDGGLGIRKFAPENLTPRVGGSGRLLEQVQMQTPSGIPGHGMSILRGVEDLGTPSAPPIMEIERETNGFEIDKVSKQVNDGLCRPRESESFNGGCKEHLAETKLHSSNVAELGKERVIKTKNQGIEEKIPYWQSNTSYNTSGQYAWQTLIAYDACIRLCLHAWARGCTEAPEFLRDECLLLRSAFGLHKFLLQPRGVQPVEVSTTTSAEPVTSLKAKKVVGKIRVEVRKIRIIPRRKLKSTYSQRSAMYMQVGVEYVQHMSSLLKSGINSLKLASFSVTSAESFLCFFQLKNATEETQLEPSSAICLHPGNGDYHVFFLETEGDALLVEVQDKKKSVQGHTTIPVSSLIDNPNDRIRWWPIYHDDQECIGKMQLSISGSTITCDETGQIKSGPVVETLAYDLLLEAAMHAQHFHSQNLRLQGHWQWLLAEFADYYGVSDSYTKLRYLVHVMNVAAPTKDCLELINELLVPILKEKSEKNLTRQEKSILLDCETQIESLLATVFENYKSLDEKSPTGLADVLGPTQETTRPALVPAVEIYILLHDILSPEAQNTLRNYFQTAARKRCRKHMIETDEFVAGNSEGFLMDFITVSTAYLKMKNLCINISKEIQADIKIHNQHILPSSIDLSNIAAAVYSTELCNRVRGFLAAWPPSSPQLHVNELLIAITDFERDLESWSISAVQGGVESRSLFHDYITVWVEDMQLKLLDLCKAEKVPWSGVTTNYSTSPFAEEMYEKVKDYLIEYEVVINRWPQYSLELENAVANVERAIVKALEKQYNDILTPLKDSIPKRLNMHVQKLTRRQLTTLYTVPNQLGIFLNTIKRVLDVLHCRIEEVLKSWASYLPLTGDKKSLFGEQMNGITVMLRTKYKNYLQATVEKLVSNMQANRNTRLKRILEEIKEEDGEAEVRERMQVLSSHLIESISNLHEVFTSQIFISACRGFWDRMGQIVLKFLEGRKENRVWYNGSYFALGILDDTFASQMQRLQGNSMQEKDLHPPRSVIEARSILCKDSAKATDASTYFYV
ncbi:hypothetical protein SLA2020_234460 [Shorea laevis]